MTQPGSLARARDYAPYGEALADSGGSSDSFYRFGGKIHHPNIGLSYFPYRYYSPAQARWTTRDPLGMVDGPNAFAYVGGNPINGVDPLGLSAATRIKDLLKKLLKIRGIVGAVACSSCSIGVGTLAVICESTSATDQDLVDCMCRELDQPLLRGTCRACMVLWGTDNIKDWLDLDCC